MQKEWLNENDYYAFTYKGVKCEIKRVPMLKHLCGYMYLTRDAPFYFVSADDIDVHCGITLDEIYKHGVRKLGFDCAHHCDLIPFNYESVSEAGQKYYEGETVYRNVEFVRRNLINAIDKLTANDKQQE